ncbi:MAG: aminotransferase class V-fold PLP-dependent enzyme [Alphaproteobacteria bacterium]|nr:aminotransferase class V-fold PLP-dependent enzyme [Alphaproteobacteria bacterium]
MQRTPDFSDDLIIPCQQRQFDMATDVTYLNCAYMSPMLHSAQNAGIAGLKRKCEPWKMGVDMFFEECEQLRSLAGQLIQCSADHIAIIPAASYGLAVAAYNLIPRLSAGDKILVLGEQFPSNFYIWHELASESEIEIVTVPVPKNGDWTRAILERIDSNIRILALPNCHWTDGTFIDLEAIREAIGEGDDAPYMVLDLTQSLGAYPFDVTKVKPDFMACATYKWAMCPYGMGILYVAEEFWSGQPIEFNWINRKRSENLARLVDYCDEYQHGARRFDVGQRSNPIMLPMAVAAFRQLIDWNPERTLATIRRLNHRLAQHTQNLPLTIADEQYRAGHMLGMHLGERWSDELRNAMQEAQIYVSYRGTGMRVSPHVYNTPEQIDRLAEFLQQHLR